MSYLQTKDYLRVIQTSELNAITGNDISIRQLVESSVESELFANLKQEFDLGLEFKSMSPFNKTFIYKGGERVYLDAPLHTPFTVTNQNTFALGDLVTYQGNVYYCSTAVTQQEYFDPAKWTKLGKQYDVFYVQLPATEFNQDQFYKKGDTCFYKDKVYTAQQDSVVSDQQSELQSDSIEAIRRGNAVPGVGQSGLKMWGNGVAYSTTGSYPTASPWIKGDNRNQMFVEMFIDMVVYKLCKRIAPNNVPEARHNAWLKATKDLEKMALGRINAQLPTLKPTQGQRIRHGGKPRENYTW